MAALAVLDTHLDGLAARPVNVVHDEFVLEVVEFEAEAPQRSVEAAMLEGYLAIFPEGKSTVEGLVEARVGTSWGEAKA